MLNSGQPTIWIYQMNQVNIWSDHAMIIAPSSLGLMLLLLLLLLHLFNAFFPRTTWVSRHQKGKPFWILLEQEMIWWQWHQLDHMQIICTSLQTDNYASTLPLSFYRPDSIPAAQPTLSSCHGNCVFGCWWQNLWLISGMSHSSTQHHRERHREQFWVQVVTAVSVCRLEVLSRNLSLLVSKLRTYGAFVEWCIMCNFY